MRLLALQVPWACDTPALFELSDEGKARLEKTFAKETTNDPKFHSLLPLLRHSMASRVLL